MPVHAGGHGLKGIGFAVAIDDQPREAIRFAVYEAIERVPREQGFAQSCRPSEAIAKNHIEGRTAIQRKDPKRNERVGVIESRGRGMARGVRDPHNRPRRERGIGMLELIRVNPGIALPGMSQRARGDGHKRKIRCWTHAGAIVP